MPPVPLPQGQRTIRRFLHRARTTEETERTLSPASQTHADDILNVDNDVVAENILRGPSPASPTDRDDHSSHRARRFQDLTPVRHESQPMQLLQRADDDDQVGDGQDYASDSGRHESTEQDEEDGGGEMCTGVVVAAGDDDECAFIGSQQQVLDEDVLDPDTAPVR
jgi:hypothetical protein